MYVNHGLQALELSETAIGQLKNLFRGATVSEVIQDAFGINWEAYLMVVDKSNAKEARKGGLEFDDEFVRMVSCEDPMIVNVFPNDIFGA